jgi:catechol 2,3-dioxygenase-like lactoylglutathione lyase family enzyme
VIVALDHVQLAIPANSEDHARAFYSGLLGLSEADKPEKLRAKGGCWFAAAEVSVHLGVQTPFQPATKAHPAFQVTNIEHLAAQLLAQNYPVTWDDAIPGTKRFYTYDPFGNRLEFLETSEPS